MVFIMRSTFSFFFFLFCLTFFSCENDIKTIKLLTSPEKLPVETDKDVELTYSDSAKLKLKLSAPELDRYAGADNYIELPKGVTILFYNDSAKVKSRLTANYAKRFSDGRMEAKNNVVVINERGEKLETEHLIWNESLSLITTEAHVKITTENEILFGEGLESNQDFSNYKILHPNIEKTVSDTTNENNN